MEKRIILIVILLICLWSISGCIDYGYCFHFDVVGGNGEISLEKNELLEMVSFCSKYQNCDKGCGETSKFISLLGGKKGSHELTFIALPDEGYQVKEWSYNGDVVEGNKSNIYTATVSNKNNYNGFISVEFEPIEN